MAHVFAVCFVASESRGLYDKLRGAFNSVRLEKCPPLPPFEECQGVAAICSRMFCRYPLHFVRVLFYGCT